MWNFREEIIYYLEENEDVYGVFTFDKKNKIATDLMDYVRYDNRLITCLNETIENYVNKYMKRNRELEYVDINRIKEME